MAAIPAWAQVAPVPNTTCGNLVTAEFGGTFGTLSGASTWRNLQIPPDAISGYRYGPPEKPTFPLAGPNSEGRYAVASRQSSSNLHDSAVHWQNLPGHNQGAPNPGSDTDAYLAVNGFTSQGTFYRQDVVLVPNQTYRLSMFAINAINLVGYNGTLPNLEVRIVNVVTGVVVASDSTGLLPDKEGAFVGPSDWTQANVDFNSGSATRFRIEVRNLVTAASDNDFAIDDITIAPLVQAGCPIDFGDAPDASNGTAQGNYQTRLADNGARHTLVGGLFIGTTATPEVDALQNATATGDADDGTGTTFNLFAGQTVTVPVGVTNTTGSNAFLSGFVDFNRDGDFLDAGEALAPVTVPTNTGTLQTVNMTFTVPTSAVPGLSVARFRLANDASQITTGTGAAARGEVEDYQVTLQSTVTLTKAWTDATAGNAVSLSITGGTSPTAGSSVAGGATTPARALANGGNTITLTEAFTTGTATNYITTLACSKNTDGSAVAVSGTGLSRTITMPADSPVTCTYTNARGATLRLQKQLPNGRFVAADQFALNIAGAGGPASVTTTGSGTTATGTATLANGTAGTAYTFSEAGASGANLANYVSRYTCTNLTAGSSTPMPSNVVGTSFNLTPQAGDDITCTFVNARNPQADLQIRKSNNAPGSLDDLGADTVTSGANTTYTLTITNGGPDAVTGAVVTDQPTSGVTCPGTGNADVVTCSGTACTGATPLTLSGLTSGGIVLGTLPNGGTTALTFTCRVD